mmetsp:Transcript_20692/g.19721  ORF Transcript_20692/g.19721 Transcript_20692/m.19721 type:complete len:94 (-) Transcript_20692:2970-3251(-)
MKLDLEGKHKKYSRYHCHELNVFLYFQDKDYFELVVKPFLKNKMEKTFIDYYLLGQYEQILHFSSFSELDKLNSLEKCFMVDVLVKNQKQEQA